MIAVDTSAFIAIVAAEPERGAMLECLWDNDTVLVSPVTVAEARMVVAGLNDFSRTDIRPALPT
ncbi:PIN domain-containing protein [Caenispirillum salinarum]|uniref:PIN domain-containing protein n=1 Tax=Caenispirillum salinarum TaxID=859058 RepID=UPI00384B620B